MKKAITVIITNPVQLTLNYKFGNQKIKAVKREAGNEEERKRTEK